MKKLFFSAKALSIVLMMLLIATYLPSTGANNIQKTQLKKMEENLDTQALLISSELILNPAATILQKDVSVSRHNEFSLNDAHDDILDQQQIEHEYSHDPFDLPYYGYIIPDDFLWAQTFVPTLPILTRVRIKLMVSDEPTPDYNVIVSIREELDGDDLAVVSLTAEDINDYEDIEMTEIDFDDIIITPGDTYFIVCQAPDQPDDIPPWYAWAFGEDTSYITGEPYMKHSGSIGGPVSGFDFMFETYGKIDDLDQQQLEHEYVSFDPQGLPYWGFVIPNNFELTQSFIPTRSTMTSIKLHLFTAHGPDFDLVITILDSNNNVLSSTLVTADQVPDYDTGLLTEIDIPDIIVTPGETYYISAVCPEFEISVSDPFPYYAWSFGEETSYLDGEANVGLIDDTDFLFETYGV